MPSGTFSKKNIEHIKRNGKYESTTVIKYVTQSNFSDGVDGEGGLSVYLDHTEKIFEGDSENKAVVGQYDTVKINAYKGLQKLDAFVDTSTGITGLISGVLSASITNNGTKDTAITFSITGSLYQESGSISIPIFIYTNSDDDSSIGDTPAWYNASENIVSFTLKYNWSVTRKGVSNYRLDLSNEAMSVNCDSSGNVLVGSYMPTCKATLYYGNTDCSTAWYEISSPSEQSLTGVSIDASGNFIFNDSSLAFQGNSIEITVTAKIVNQTYGVAIASLIKNIPGAAGAAGRDGSVGQDAVNYWLSLSCDAVHVNPNENTLVADPSTMTAVVYKQVGIQTPVIDSSCVIKYDYDSSTVSTTYSSAITIDPSKSYISFGAYLNNVLVDGIETVPILKDGIHGTQGTQGTVGTQGAQGYTGIVYRRSVWDEDVSTGKVLRNDSALQTYDDRYIDMVFNKNNALLNDPTLKLFKTKVTHTASNDIPLTNTTYFEEVPITDEFYAANIFAGQLSADVIDVGTIKVTDLADINNLVVKQIKSNNNTFIVDASGNMTATSGTFYGNVRIPLTTIECGYYGNTSDLYYLGNTNACNFKIAYGYTSSTSEKYVRVMLPNPSSTYNGTCYMFIMPPRSSSLESTDQLAGMKLFSYTSTSKLYNYSNLSSSTTSACSAIIFGPGMCRVLCDGSYWYVIESSSYMRMYYSSAWHDSNQILSTTVSGMELSGTVLTIL